ncbi:PilC/PilY family type IV pilus protein [Acinetobacter nematophilus]|uniref:PilC/PilY family type IV pilus protein n=1 Tax=Acinetobacter nematophilus TaxID=2994642 RepID=UPI003AF995D9
MNKNNQVQNDWIHFKVSTLTASITSLILMSLPIQLQASDIDIYQAGGTGTTKIYLMLDVSGSMDNADSFNVDYGYAYTERVCNFIFCRDVERNLCNRTNLTNNLTVNIPNKDNTATTTYTYATRSDNYCAVDLSSSFIGNTNDDRAYKTKIASICDRVGNTNTYNCYSRIINLRKGLIEVIADPTVDKDIQFGLGTYSGNAITSKTDFIAMDPATSNKTTLIGYVQGISAGGGTPIATAYNVAGKKFTSQSGSSNTSQECTGNGLYFLTDGEPQGDNNYNIDYNGINKVTTNTLGSSQTAYWGKIGNYAQSLLKSNYKVKTATVGFGGGYYLTPAQKLQANITIGTKKYFDCTFVDTNDSDHRNYCQWGAKTIPNRTGVGGFGEGGFYTAQSSSDLVESLKSFITETTVPIEGSTIGSSTIPVDALNTNQLQPFAYFPMFKPLIETEDQLWAGNLKKFNVINGSLYDITNKAVFRNSTDFNSSLKDYWLNTSVTHPDEALSYGGNLSQLLGTKMPKLDSSNNLVLQRNLFINSDSTAGELKPATAILKEGTFTNREYLYGLLGYSKLTTTDLTTLQSKSYDEQLAYLKAKDAAKGYQLGSIIHSSPILLTQKGAIVTDGSGVMGSAERDDYILFGTTQGVLHVVKSGTQNTQVTNGNGVAEGSGVEEFAFVPKEIIEKQKNGFFESMAMQKSANGFYYGIDGPWTAHTVYEPNFYDIVVAGEKVTRDGLQVKADSSLSHQYVYGGLRMGGRSYYGLNLSNMSKPKLMFHINPESATSGDALFYMGQSWSKPTVAYIKWNGQRKLAMIVGGGYDIKYENPSFTNSTSGAVKGNGVYIFDAENGKLLWWGSSNAKNANGTTAGGAATEITDMVNSIPSRVKAVDRDGDGLIDHIYVGDLGGKIFRIDLNPNHKAGDSNDKFVLNAFTFANVKESGKMPARFYEAPTFTIHTDTKGKKFAVLSLASGDRSSPLKSETSSADDMILGFYDTSVITAKPTEGALITLTNMNEIYKAGAAKDKTAGWYYRLPKIDSKYQTRGLSEGIALDGDLYYSIFDPSKTNNNSAGTSTSCSGGIVGVSSAYKLCLPSGVCGTNTTITKVADLGAGIISLNVGPGSKKGTRTLIMNDPSQVMKDQKGTMIEYQTTNKLLPIRWYDLTPYVGAK